MASSNGPDLSGVIVEWMEERLSPSYRSAEINGRDWAMESQWRGIVDRATESGNEIWTVDLQIRSTAEIVLLLHKGWFIARALWLTIRHFQRGMVIG